MPDVPSLVEALGWTPWALVPLYLLGIATAVDAVMKSRTPQGSTAWVFALATIPLVALPIYWILGRFKFDDYLEALREFDERIARGVEKAMDGGLQKLLVDPEADGYPARPREVGEMHAFSTMATLPFTCGNDVRLLIDGHETFDAILAAIDARRVVRARAVLHHPRRRARHAVQGDADPRRRARRGGPPALRRASGA